MSVDRSEAPLLGGAAADLCASSAAAVPAGLHLTLIAPDSLTLYASQLHQAFLNTLHRQHEQRHRTQPDVAADTELDAEDDDDSPPHPHHQRAQQPHPLSTDELPILWQVSLYIHLPEEATVDFIARLQQGALPRGLFEQHIAAARSRHRGVEEDVGEEEEDGPQLSGEAREEQEGDEEESVDADEDRAEDDHGDGEEEESSEAIEELSWRAMDGRAFSAGSASSSSSEFSSTAHSEDDDGQSVTPPLAPMFTPRHRCTDTEQRHPRDWAGAAADSSSSHHELQQAADAAASEAPTERDDGGQRLPRGLFAACDLSQSSDHWHAAAPAGGGGGVDDPPQVFAREPLVPPLDLFRLFPAAYHVNFLLYDGLREDIAFSYFQVNHTPLHSHSHSPTAPSLLHPISSPPLLSSAMLCYAPPQFMQHLSSQLKEHSSTSSSSLPLFSSSLSSSLSSCSIPPTVLLLYNGWQILHRCEQDEETEERIKKLLNLCDVVVVTDEELCSAYQQLCPHVLVIPHGYHVDASEGDAEEGAELALSPLSSAASTSSSASSTSSMLFAPSFSPVPRAPRPSPAGSPPLSPRGGGEGEAVSSPSSLSVFHSPDLVHAVNQKRDRLQLMPLMQPAYSPVLPYIHSSPSPLPSAPSPTPALFPSPPSCLPQRHIHVIAYLPTDDDVDDCHCISWPDVWALRSALLSASSRSSSPPPPYLFFLHGAPITAEEEPLVTFLTASHLEQHHSGSYHDLPSFRRFLYQQSHHGQKIVVVYGLFTKDEVRRLCRDVVDFELRVTRDVDDGGWVGGRMHRSVPIVLELSNCLSHLKLGASLVVIRRADPADHKACLGEDDSEDERALDVTPDSVGEEEEGSMLSSVSSGASSCDFSFSPSFHLYPADAYDHAGAALQVLEMMGRGDGVQEALRWNARVMKEWSLEVIARLYLRMFQSQLLQRGKAGVGLEGAVVTRASWYST